MAKIEIYPAEMQVLSCNQYVACVIKSLHNFMKESFSSVPLGCLCSILNSSQQLNVRICKLQEKSISH